MNKLDNEWQQKGNCYVQKLPVQLFYPGPGQVISRDIVDACASCPVKKECLEHALIFEKYGYWGGTSEKSRIRIRKERKLNTLFPDEELNLPRKNRAVAVCGTRAGYAAHKRKGEPYCDECKLAKSAIARDYHQIRKELA